MKAAFHAGLWCAVLLPGLLASCASSHDLAAAAPGKVQEHPYGDRVVLLTTGKDPEGELIGLHQGSYVVKDEYDDTLVFVDTARVYGAVVKHARTSDNPQAYGWSAALPLISLSHGGFALFTLPMNIIAAVAVNNGAAKSRYVVYFTRGFHSAELVRFARFPQGVPPAFLPGPAP